MTSREDFGPAAAVRSSPARRGHTRVSASRHALSTALESWLENVLVAAYLLASMLDFSEPTTSGLRGPRIRRTCRLEFRDSGSCPKTTRRPFAMRAPTTCVVFVSTHLKGRNRSRRLSKGMPTEPTCPSAFHSYLRNMSLENNLIFPVNRCVRVPGLGQNGYGLRAFHARRSLVPWRFDLSAALLVAHRVCARRERTRGRHHQPGSEEAPTLLDPFWSGAGRGRVVCRCSATSRKLVAALGGLAA